MFKVLGVVSLIIWTICATVGIVNNFDHYTIGDWIVVVILTVIPYIVYFAVKHKKKANKPSGEHAVLDAVHNTDSPQINDAQNEIANNSPIHADVTITSNPPTAYVESGSTISRADGKPISDEEVPYLMEIGYRRALEVNQSRPKISDRDQELVFQFMQNHGNQSSKHCVKFKSLNCLAYEETDIDKKIVLLQQAIEAFEAAKQWHYNYSNGAKIYFQEFWERLHNSRSNCFSWVDPVKEELEYQTQKRDLIIPWILENAETGFLQTQIYKEFPGYEKGVLRGIIDELAKRGLIVKDKKGNSYYITKKQNEF